MFQDLPPGPDPRKSEALVVDKLYSACAGEAIPIRMESVLLEQGERRNMIFQVGFGLAWSMVLRMH